MTDRRTDTPIDEPIDDDWSQARVDAEVERIDAEFEPRRPPPRIVEYVGGALLYGMIVAVDAILRRRR